MNHVTIESRGDIGNGSRAIDKLPDTLVEVKKRMQVKLLVHIQERTTNCWFNNELLIDILKQSLLI